MYSISGVVMTKGHDISGVVMTNGHDNRVARRDM
jgi:hypothetical protein